ncbi:MAG: DUF1553 domain-containing protein [Pirellulales bacterium]
MFDSAADGIVRDRSNFGEPLDLRIETPSSVAWTDAGLRVDASARIVSVGPARKVNAAIQRTGSLTIEAWVASRDNRQTGPARIVSLSADTGRRNLTLGQDGAKYDVRLRTSSTSENGVPSLATADDTQVDRLTHVVFTRDATGVARIYLDGRESAVAKREGDLSKWGDEYRLALANEITGDRPWLGELQLVAIYERALSEAEVVGNFRAGPPARLDYEKVLPPASKAAVDFVRDIQPLLRKHCFDCHSQDNEEGGLNLTVRQRAFEGGEHGVAIRPGDSAHSRLIHWVAEVEKGKVMPPEGERLSREQVGMLRAWIDQGAKWPRDADWVDERIEAARRHWAFQPLKSVESPAVADKTWSRTAIDRFILAKLEANNLPPAPPADATRLIRRLYFDLIGLPPSPQEVDEFVAESARDGEAAYRKWVERLLESRHFGERWGRHWLDIAHYADSDGMESDRDRPTAYPYRDFVIRAFNEDMPFQQFVRWQIAGDEYEPANPAAVAATGFLVCGPREGLGANLLELERLRARYNELDDLLSTIGTGFLGLTLGCARCHDHKYDPIPSRDYYRLLSAFHSGDRTEVAVQADGSKTLAYRDFGAEPRATWYFRRADFMDRRQTVRLGFVNALTSGKTPDAFWDEARKASTRTDSTGQRRAVAEWLTDEKHGAGSLLARVIVNRLWQHHFGEPLVATVSDFGTRAAEPTHPELLEWLAADLAQNGWRLKRVHREMVMSSTYRQMSAGVTPPAQDPENRWLWKMRPRRLEAEVLRDTMLDVSGTLNREPYGPAFKPRIAAEAMLARNVKDPYPAKITDSPALRRRSVYMFHKRVVPYPLLQAFDKPDAQQSCGRRDRTTVAPQALTLLNDPFVRGVSYDFADRLLRESGDAHDDSFDKSVEIAYRLAFSRMPQEAERSACVEFLARQRDERLRRGESGSPEDVRRRALADFCQTLFGLNEFLYID